MFIDPADIVDSDGDMDSAERWFGNKTPSGTVEEEGANDAQFAQHIAHANAIHTQYQLQSSNSPYHARVNQSYKNISLPEALLYYTILTNKSATNVHATLVLKKTPHLSPIIQLALTIQYKKEHTIWELHYHMINKTVILYKDGQKCGRVHYRIRGMKVEEIDGTLQGHPLVLDPVWHPQTQGELREDRLKIGPYNINLIYQFNESYSVGAPKDQSLRVSHSRHKRSVSNAVIRKHVQIQDVKGPAQILYMRGILIPICGEWSLKHVK